MCPPALSTCLVSGGAEGGAHSCWPIVACDIGALACVSGPRWTGIRMLWCGWLSRAIPTLSLMLGALTGVVVGIITGEL